MLVSRENNVEIRELEANLRLAYINKARAAQLAERELEKQRNLHEKCLENEENEKIRQLRIEEEEEEERQEALAKIRYQKQLDT